jgi:amino-acid N-acetyltransferase
MVNLPAADLTDAHMRNFFYCGEASAPFALVGVEFCGRSALLRSLVVAPGHRTRGLGSLLVRHVETVARRNGVSAVYLLTTDAGSFFERCGYVIAKRDSAPAEIRATREFSEFCPTDAVLLVKKLSG